MPTTESSYIEGLHRMITRAINQRNEAREALLVAARALYIAEDWHVEEVQCTPPREWELDSCDGDAEEGWCSTAALARKLREIAEEASDD